MQKIGIARPHKIGRVGPARREYLALQGISHDGIVRAEQYSDELQAGPAVVFRHGAHWQRLDQFIATNSDLPLETRLEMIRQLAEALDHRPPHPAARGPRRGHALGPPVAQRARPELRPEPRGSL
jgi:hypothetical protein